MGESFFQRAYDLPCNKERTMDKRNSNRIFLLMIAIYALMAALGVFLPQASTGGMIPTGQLPAPLWVIVLANVGLAIVIYGGLGFIGLILSRKLDLPEIWDSAVSNRQRFLIPALIAAGIAIIWIVGDTLFAPLNGIGRFPHPPFPTSIVASIGAGIGEEILFRLFFTCLWTWIVSRLILRGRWQTQVYWVVSIVAAVAFGISHLPGVMFLFGWTSMAQVPTMLLVEMILLNGILGLTAACCLRKYGFLAPVGIHMWTDIFWHVLFGALV
jgi:hypothetical protein